MSILIQKNNLLAALAPIQAASVRHTNMPILAHVRLQTQQDHVIFTATDLDIEVVTRCPAVIEGDGLLTTTPAAMLYEIVRHVSDASPTVRLEMRDTLFLQAGHFESLCHTLPADGFPIMPDATFSTQVSLPASLLKKAVEQTRMAMSNDESRYCLCGLYWHEASPEEGLCMVATDGHRLAKVGLGPLPGMLNMPGVIIPKKTVAHLHRLLSELPATESITCSLAPGKIRFQMAQATLTSKLIDGTFPDYARAIPTGYDKQIDVNTKTLLEALSRVTIVTSERNRFVTLYVSQETPNMMTLSSENPELGSTKEMIAVAYSGPDMKISFNARYLSEMIVAIAQDEVSLHVVNAQSAAIIQTRHDPQILYVLMPVCA